MNYKKTAATLIRGGVLEQELVTEVLHAMPDIGVPHQVPGFTAGAKAINKSAMAANAGCFP
jgi:hypothetical protein